jgi:hypothetical protein
MASTSPGRVLRSTTSPPTRDYYPAMVSAVSKLESNTAEARQALFDQALALLVERLRMRQPPVAEPEIVRERSALKAAIRRVELEFAEIEARGAPGYPARFIFAGWKLLREFSTAAIGVKQAFAELRTWPRERKMELALVVAVGWIIGDLLGSLSFQHFWAAIAWGFAGAIASTAIVYARRRRRSGAAYLAGRADEP